jgi:hypothetical protein
MPSPAGKKYGNRKTASRAALARIRRQRAHVGRYGNCPVVVDLERELQAAYAAIRGADGAVASRALLDAAEGYQHPHRFFLRRLIEGLEKRADPDALLRPLRLIEQYILDQRQRLDRGVA